MSIGMWSLGIRGQKSGFRRQMVSEKQVSPLRLPPASSKLGSSDNWLETDYGLFASRVWMGGVLNLPFRIPNSTFRLHLDFHAPGG